jgi:cytochrome c554/c'-like protein
MEAMGRLGYAAANLGEKELLLGTERLQAWAKQAGVPLLSSNLVYQDTGEPAFPPSLSLTTSGGPTTKRKLRVGILGLAKMNTGLSSPTPDGRRIVTADPLVTAKALVPPLRKKCDLLVVLTTMEPNQARDLAKQVAGIDLILGGFGAVEISEEVGADTATPGTRSTRLTYVGNQGKKIGEILVFLSEPGRLSRLESNTIILGTEIPDDPAIMDLVEKNRIAINEIRKKEAPLVDGEKLRTMWQGESFVKATACKSCHEDAFKTWEESSHAHAFRILESKNQDYNPECVACHTTGFRRPTGFVNAKSTPDLENVQCEACHGPGNRHPEEIGAGYGSVSPEFCVSCHTPANSPDFNDAVYRLKIRHWGEKPAPAAASAASR